jgi:splicing factor 3A subunit 3
MSILEQLRADEELLERYECLIINELSAKPSGQLNKVKQQHKIDKYMKTINELAAKINEIYEDKDKSFSEDVASIKFVNSGEMLTSFYEQLSQKKEYHEKYPNIKFNNEPDEQDIDVPFSGEEVYGKYFDLHLLYNKYCNIPNIMKDKKLDYDQYLLKFNSFFYILETYKTSKHYLEYINELWNYLEDFFSRTQPLVNLSESISEWEQKFNSLWQEGKIMGWLLVNSSSSKDPIKLNSFNSAKELEALGLDRLKEGLEAIGLKCGGNLQERAERLYSVKGLKPDQYPAKIRAKMVSSDSTNTDNRRNTAWIEYKIICITDVLSDILVATRKRMEKKHTRTRDEIEQELMEEEQGALPDINDAMEEDKDDEEPIYNPKKLPLGWDGKPMPYWLWKLHGLSKEFKCEICGNQVYQGRRNFDRHFQEWRHAHGMRCLGIPNTKHFHDITLIEDALTLYSKIKHIVDAENFIHDKHEEYEDTEGNILDRRTYEALARQSLL